MNRIALLSPLDGWLLPLAEVPDAVFAQGLAGDGVAIDPVAGTLHAPCAGDVLPLGSAAHAVSLRVAEGCDLLLHVGIDTVALGGAGFEALVRPGQHVAAGEALLRFDVQALAEAAPSAVTPLVLSGIGRFEPGPLHRAVKVGEALGELWLPDPVADAADVAAGPVRHGRFRVPFEHGLHARPAAQMVAALRGLAADVFLLANGRRADLRSTVALMALGLRCGDDVEVQARGAQAGEALRRLAALLSPPAETPRKTEAPASRTILLGEALTAVAAVPGKALGVAVPLLDDDTPLDAASRSADAERAALHEALATVLAHLRHHIEHADDERADGEQAGILAAHVELLQDPHLREQAQARIDAGASAASGWRAATRAASAELTALADPHLRARAADLRDLERQVLRVLAGEAIDAGPRLPERAIVLADELLPSDFLRLDASRLAGIAMARGGSTSHVAILAAARGIPTLVAAGPAVLDIAPGTPLILDGEAGTLHVDPPETQCRALDRALSEQAERERGERAAAHLPATTTDGIGVRVMANVGALREAEGARALGADGCGLLRSEFLYLDRRDAPDEALQAREYAAFASAFGELPLTVRTLDAGGDKPIPYLPLPREDNPALGLRGLRTGLRHPELLVAQLRALLRVGRPQQIRILLPMVNEPGELAKARAMLDACAYDLGLDRAPALGVMIETPASALLAAELLREADFLSIGSNDLAQYALAMDRGHPELAAHLDGLHPAVLRLIATTAQAAHAAQKKISLCGGLGADPLALPILLGLGVHELSVVPGAIPRIKAQVRRLAMRDCAGLAHCAIRLNSAAEVRALARRWQPAAAPAMQEVPG